MKAEEYISERLTPEQFITVINALPAFIAQANGDQFFTAMYGFDCALQNELLFVPMRLLPDQLPRFFKNSISQRIFQPGHNDLHISLPEDRLTLTFCHEGDMHVCGRDRRLVEQVLAALPFAALNWKQSGGA